MRDSTPNKLARSERVLGGASRFRVGGAADGCQNFERHALGRVPLPLSWNVAFNRR